MRTCVVRSSVRHVLYLSYCFFLPRVYQNLTAVAQQVEAYSSLPNLLLWETAHEPDGNSDPFGAARSTYDLIYQMDGYHPISIVLNCQVNCPTNFFQCEVIEPILYRTITSLLTWRAQISCSRTHTQLASMPPTRLSGILHVPPTLVTAAVITARATYTTSKPAPKPSKTGLTSLVMIVPRLYGPHLRPLAVERESVHKL